MSTLAQTPTEIQVANNPFPGLRPFEFDESHLFFGRDGQSEQLIAKLSRTRFLAVVGTSGSGKSSLVRAGFLPALWGGFMTSAGSGWRVAVMRPGNDPIGNLARALNAPDVFGSEVEENVAIQTAMAESTLRRGSLGLVDTLRQAVMDESENLLIVVDQFEEIFRFARVAEGEEYGNEAAAFIKLLLEASRQREVPIYLVLTMRSDYLGDCSQFWGLPEAINESQYLIPRLTRDQLREAISGPVAVGGGKITPRLVNRLLNEVGDNQDQLPVLQHLLMRSWHEWNEKRLTVEVEDGKSRPHSQVHQGDAIDLCCADAVGGMAKALSRHADEAFFELPNEYHREVSAKLFKALTEKGTDNREIRRPITLAEICDITDARASEVITVIEAFRQPGRSFLMPPAGVALDSQSLVDISHESLIRGWTRLKDWVDEEARSARIYRRLAETAVLNKEGNAGLWRDPDLQIALNWREETKPNEVWARRYHPEFALASNFLDESVSARDAQVARDEARRKKEINRSRLTALIFGVAFLFSLGMGVYAYGAKNKAESARNEAVAERKVADGLRDAAISQNELKDRALARAKIAEIETAAAEAKKDDALARLVAEKTAAEKAKNDALAQKKSADIAKNAALAERNRAEALSLQGQALGALKEQDPDGAIKFFEELEKLYMNRKPNPEPGGVSYALSSIADIHRDRAPVGLFATMGEGQLGGSFPDIDQDESELVKRYYQSLMSMSSLTSGGNDDLAREELTREATTAVKVYHRALDANQKNTGPDHSLKEAGILNNLGDLQIGLAQLNVELEETDKKAAEQQAEVEIKKGIEYYAAARLAYKTAGLHAKEGEVLRKVGDILLRFLLKKPDKPTQILRGMSDSDRAYFAESDTVIDYYDQAAAAFALANQPLLQARTLYHAGDVYLAITKDIPAKRHDPVRYLEAAKEIYGKEKSYRLEGLVNSKLADFYEDQKENDKALSFYKEAFIAYQRASVDPKKQAENLAGAYEMLAKAGNLLFDSGGKVEANRFFEQGISLSKDPAQQAVLLERIGQFYKGKDDAEAIRYYLREREIAHAAGDFLEEGNTLFTIGTMQLAAGDSAAAISSYEGARTAYRRVDPTSKKGNGISVTDLTAIAAFYTKQDKQKAIATYDEALRIELGANGYQVQTLLQSQGQLLLEMKTNDARAQARQLFEKVVAYYHEKKNAGAEALSLLTAGDLYASAEERTEARAYYDRGRKIYVGSRDIYPLLNVLKKIGELEVAQTPQTTMVQYYLSEVEAAERNRDSFSQGVALEAIAVFHREQKKYAEAIEYFERARQAYHAAGITPQEISVTRAMSYLYSEMGNKEKAEELRKLAEQMSAPPR